jgi:hypothetical protein
MTMATVQVTVRFEPQTLKANKRNEAMMQLAFENVDGEKQYWCECEIAVKSPLSLAGDRELDAGRTRIGIVKPKESKSKQVKLYTRPNNFPDSYNVGITTFVYGEDGTIAERLEQTENIVCEG